MEKTASCGRIIINVPAQILDVSKVLFMITPDSNERLFALCALIAEEKDQSKFLLLVQELNGLLENRPNFVAPPPMSQSLLRV